MQLGGAERVMSRLASHFADEGHEVVLFTYETPGAVPFYALSPSVSYRPLGLSRASRHALDAIVSNIRRLLGIRRAVRAAALDILISFCTETNVAVLLATRGMGLQIIVSERAEPAAHAIGMFWRLGRRMGYLWAHRVVVQTESARDFFSPVIRRRTVVIPNPVPVPAISTSAVTRGPCILGVGRFSREKGFDLLIAAFALARRNQQASNWKLRLVGEGAEKNALQSLARELGLSDVIEWPGKLHAIHEEYEKAAIFVLPSRYEGFPNTLCEAMAAGMPVVAFACSAGVCEIVRNGVNGELVPPSDTVAMAEALSRLMLDPARRLRLGGEAHEVTTRFSPDAVWGKWERCLPGKVAS